MTEETGSKVSMTGKLNDSGPALMRVGPEHGDEMGQPGGML